MTASRPMKTKEGRHFDILAAIDLKDGRCVRLRQGRAEEAKVYSSDPMAMARRWVDDGAPWLHVVDLDGAFQGRPVHTQTIARIVEAAGVPVQVGGGLRTDADIHATLEAGAARVVLGTRAFADPAGLASLAKRYGERLAVGIDARDGWVQVRGWVETTGKRAVDLAREADEMGIRTLICTDTATDGMLRGVNLRAMDAICAAVRCDVIASGGVGAADDLRGLIRLNRPNLKGVVVGKALYEGRVTVAELVGVVDGCAS